MMKKIQIVPLLFLASCLANNTLETASIADQNVYRLGQVCVGMSEEQVFARMRSPNREEQIMVGDDLYDIWFYITRGTLLDQDQLMHRNLTPIIFKNGKFIGKGYTLYDQIIYMASVPAPPEKKEEEKENKPLEKTLQKSISMIRHSSSKQKEEKEGKEKKGYEGDEDDQRMLEEEQDENFNIP